MTMVRNITALPNQEWLGAHASVFRLIRECSAVVGALLAVGILSGCGQIPPHGLVKTPLMDRVRTNFPALGISMEIPNPPPKSWGHGKLSYYGTPSIEGNTRIEAEMLLVLHPFYGGLLVEPQYWLQLWIIRLTPDQFQVFLAGRHFYNYDAPFGEHPEPFQETVRMRKGRDGNKRSCDCVRRDTKLTNGDIVVAGAYVLESVPDTQDDLEQLKAILNSIQPLEKTGRSEGSALQGVLPKPW